VPSDAEVLTLYHDGVEVIGRLVEDWDAAQWARPACGGWTGTDLAGHLVTVIGWYHTWLDRALAGDASPEFPIDELDAQAAIAPFRAEAERYATRVAEHWDVAYGYPRGSVTAGLHVAVAAVEWHVHAWDLARAAGGDHTPTDPAPLFLAAAHCRLAADGAMKARLGMPVARLAARRDPWHELLHRMGRV
jgi:uncharacterized protein (TIGR03083 family)